MTDARLDNGLLHIELEQPVIEPQVRQVEIKTAGKGQAVRTRHSGSGKPASEKAG